MKISGKKLFFRLSAAALLFLGGYFFLTSSWMVIHAYLKIGSYFAGLELTAERAEWRPFKKDLAFYNFRIGEKDFPWVNGEKLYGKYHIGDVLRGEIRWSNLYMENGECRIIVPRGPTEGPMELQRQYDGSDDDFFWWLNRFDLRRMRISNCRVHYFERYKKELRKKFILYNLKGFLTMLRPDSESELDISGKLRMEDFNDIFIESGNIDLKASGRLGKYLIPERLSTIGDLSDCRGRVSGKELAGDKLSWDILLDRPRRHEVMLKRINILQYDKNDIISSIQFGGAIGIDPFKLKTSFEMEKLSPELFSLLCELIWSFNPGEVKFSGGGDFEYGGDMFAGRGKFKLDRRGKAFFGGRTADIPDFTINSISNFRIDMNKQLANVGELLFELSRNGEKTIDIQLRDGVNYLWAEDNGNAGALSVADKGTLDILFRQFDLRILRLLPFWQEKFDLERGVFNASLTGKFLPAAPGIGLAGNAAFEHMDIKLNDQLLHDVDINLALAGSLTPEKGILFDRLTGTVVKEKRLLAKCEGDWNGSVPKKFMKGTLLLSDISSEMIYCLIPKESLPAVKSFIAPWQEGKGRLSLDYLVDQQKTALKNWNASWRAGAMEFSGKVGNQEFSGAENLSQSDWRIDFKARMPVGYLEKYGADPSGWVDGELTAAGQINFGRNFEKLNSLLSVSLNDAKFKLGSRPPEKIKIEGDFTVNTLDYDHWSISRADFYLQAAGESALRLEFPSALQLKKNSFAGELTIRYMNRGFLNLFCPGLFKAADASGKVMVAADDLANLRLRANGSLGAGKVLFAGHEERPVDTRLEFKLERDAERLMINDLTLRLRNGQQETASATLNFIFPHDETKLNFGYLEFKDIDGEYWRQFLSSPVPPPSAVPPPSVSPPGAPAVAENVNFSFDFGKEQYELDMAVKNLNFASGSVSGYGKVSASGRKIKADRILLASGGGRLESHWDFESEPDGPVRFRTRGRNTGALPVEVLLRALANWPGSSGEIDRIRWEFTGEAGPNWDRTLTGGAEAEFQKITLSNNMADGVLGKILFLPMEVILRLSGVLPKDLASLESWKRAGGVVGSVKSHSRNIAFDTGKLDIKAKDGVLRINEFFLSGLTVRRLEFKGLIRLYGEDNLALRSKISVAGMDLPLRIKGSLDEPEIGLLELLPETVGANVTKIFTTIWGVVDYVVPRKKMEAPPPEANNSAGP